MSILPKVDPEFKALIPPLAPEEHKQLEENILKNRKCRDAIVLWDNTIIDGHNRFEICIKHGIEFELKELDLPSREAAKLWILENQLGRRNLPEAMMIEIALMKAEMLREKARKNQSLAGGDRKSEKGEESLFVKTSKPKNDVIHVHTAIAEEAGVSEKTLHRYTQIKETGNPELLAQVQSGAIKIGTAHRMLTKEIQKQLSGASKMYNFIEERVAGSLETNPLTKETKQTLSTGLVPLYAQLDELIIKLVERKTHATT